MKYDRRFSSGRVDGNGPYRLIKSLGHECVTVAPSIIPKRRGERVKSIRAGELAAAWVPDEWHAVMLDLSRGILMAVCPESPKDAEDGVHGVRFPLPRT